MISLTRISKQYGRQVLFVDTSFQLNPGERVGLVGPNGAGKTTLFRMIVGEEVADEGEIAVPRKLAIGYFRQDVEDMSGRSVLDEAIAGSGRVGTLHHELEALEHAMADPDQADRMDEILARFGEVQEEYDHLGGYALEAQARDVLEGLGFDQGQIDGDVGALSGGWKMRVAMARVLLGRPDVALLLGEHGLLSRIGRLTVGLANRPLAFVEVVVPGVGGDLTAIDLGDARDDAVHELAVVRRHEQRCGK